MRESWGRGAEAERGKRRRQSVSDHRKEITRATSPGPCASSPPKTKEVYNAGAASRAEGGRALGPEDAEVAAYTG